ncbi:MAG: hypothetical protein JWN46_177 [Acidimicrobiales bacterium]|nr:hypothetical protein [Acidimicrobiales bacterium]
MIDGADLELFTRSLRHATDSSTGAALDAALDDLGWPDALADDPRAAVSILFGLQGGANATSSALDHVLLAALAPLTPFAPLELGGSPVAPATAIPPASNPLELGGNPVAPATAIPPSSGVGVGAGVGVVLPALGGWHPPGDLRGGRLAVAGLGTAGLAHRATAIVVARAGDKTVAVAVPTASLTLRAVQGVDPELGLIEVTADGLIVAVDPDADPLTGWTNAVALAQVALGHELVGASRTMLDLARIHALERVQFGRPISAFQAVRHRLAETLVAIEMAEALLDAAWLDQSPQTAAMAKALAGRGARTAARHCQQVLAGIGFTTEHPLHRYVRRILVLDQLYGAAQSLTAALGTELIATRQLPPLLPL